MKNCKKQRVFMEKTAHSKKMENRLPVRTALYKTVENYVHCKE